MLDYYQLLELAPDATREEIESAHDFLWRSFDPLRQKTPADIQRAQVKRRHLALAISVLADPVKRGDYDRHLSALSASESNSVSAAMGQESDNAGLRPTPGDPFTLSWLDLRMNWVPPGRFEMGVAEGESDERPVTDVEISTGFWLGTCEVTQAQWEKLMGDNPSYFKAPDHPVDGVSWLQANDFCRRLNELARAAGTLPPRYSYQLPTEAQWEYACRAGEPHENLDFLSETAWHFANSGNVSHAVGQKVPNAWGFHDLRGNVWEWCSDWYDVKLPGGFMADPHGPKNGTHRVYRGGGWFCVPAACRRSNRGYAEPGYHCNDIGFRLALVRD